MPSSCVEGYCCMRSDGRGACCTRKDVGEEGEMW